MTATETHTTIDDPCSTSKRLDTCIFIGSSSGDIQRDPLKHTDGMFTYMIYIGVGESDITDVISRPAFVVRVPDAQ